MLSPLQIKRLLKHCKNIDENYEELDMDGTPASKDSSYITATNPAKKVVLYSSPIAGDAVDAGDASMQVTVCTWKRIPEPCSIANRGCPWLSPAKGHISLSRTCNFARPWQIPIKVQEM